MTGRRIVFRKRLQSARPTGGHSKPKLLVLRPLPTLEFRSRITSIRLCWSELLIPSFVFNLFPSHKTLKVGELGTWTSKSTHYTSYYNNRFVWKLWALQVFGCLQSKYNYYHRCYNILSINRTRPEFETIETVGKIIQDE